MRNLSIDEVLEIHRAEGRPLFSLQPRTGEFDVAAYDVRTGERVWREVKPNLVTRELSESLFDQQVVNANVFISSDQKAPHPLKTLYRSTFQAGGSVPAGFDINLPSRLWTLTGTVLAPAAGKTRTFKTVGVARAGYTTRSNSSAIYAVYAATLLSSVRVQDETQQVVVSYRLAWEEGHNV